MKKKVIAVSTCGLLLAICLVCLLCSHYRYAKRATEAQKVPNGAKAKPGSIYFVSFPENTLDLSICGWHPNIGHASLLTRDSEGVTKQYDYGWFVGHSGKRPKGAIGYVDENPSFGVVTRKTFSWKMTNDEQIARAVLDGMSSAYGKKVELWSVDVGDIGIAERYFEQLADDKDRGSMAWQCWQIGGYRCGNVTRQAFDAARGNGHFLDLLWGGFPGADAPSIGTVKTVYVAQ